MRDKTGAGAQPIALVCLPYAGGSSATYLTWKKLLAPGIELVPVELAGRRSRAADPLYTGMAEAVRDVRIRLDPVIAGGVYALFGHSLGTVIVYELCRTLQAEGKPQPAHVFFSGRFPPFLAAAPTSFHTLPDDQFIAQMGTFTDAPIDLFQNKEFLTFALPLLRHDYRLVETYRHAGEKLSLHCPVTVFHGTRDALVTRAEMERWCECARGAYSFHEIEDGHFFINTRRQEIVAIINRELGTA
jgi:medium-chain acyl-[acyl-carrier-protein] hydrolase